MAERGTGRSRVGAGALAALVALAGAACTSSGPSEEEASGNEELAAMALPGVEESALNRAVDPCTDFYEFACGGYIASVPEEVAHASRSFSQLQNAQLAILDRVVEILQIAPRTDGERKAAAFYQSCLAEDGGAKTAAFRDAFRVEISVAKTPDALARVVAKLHRRRASALFGVFPTSDTARVGREGAAVVFPAGYDQRATNYSDAESIRARTELVMKTIAAAEPGLDPAEARQRAETTVRLEISLAHASEASASEETPHPIGQSGLQAATPHFDWKTYFTALGGPSLGDFPVYGLTSFAKLDELLTQASVADLQTYLTAHWYESTVFKGPPEPELRAKYCRGRLTSSFADAIETPFLQLAGVDAKAQSKARTMFKAIVDTFEQQLDAAAFLDVPTRIEAKVKLSRMRAAIGGSKTLDDYADVTPDPTDSFVVLTSTMNERAFAEDLRLVGKRLPLLHVDFPAPVVNASADLTLNKINVPGGIMGGFFFSGAAAPVANFAALGTVLGHELTHHFDNNGRQFDSTGVMRDWWSPSVAQGFEQRAQCMVDQYGAVTYDIISATTGQPAHIDGQLTLGENIADNGGLKAALMASKIQGRTTPIVAGFTPLQQFFVGYGQLWCEKTSPAVLMNQLANDPHSPNKARVNVTLQNMPEFAGAFQCQPGKPMVPANRCSVW